MKRPRSVKTSDEFFQIDWKKGSRLKSLTTAPLHPSHLQLQPPNDQFTGRHPLISSSHSTHLIFPHHPSSPTSTLAPLLRIVILSVLVLRTRLDFNMPMSCTACLPGLSFILLLACWMHAVGPLACVSESVQRNEVEQVILDTCRESIPSILNRSGNLVLILCCYSARIENLDDSANESLFAI
jgi:hypothetical protein